MLENSNYESRALGLGQLWDWTASGSDYLAGQASSALHSTWKYIGDNADHIMVASAAPAVIALALLAHANNATITPEVANTEETVASVLAVGAVAGLVTSWVAKMAQGHHDVSVDVEAQIARG